MDGQSEIRSRIVRRVVLTVVIAAVAVWVAISLINIIARQGKVALSIYSVPTDALVHIGEDVYRHGQTVYLDPDTYTVRAEREGFITDEQSILLDPSEEQPVIANFGLTPDSDEAREWASENMDLYLQYEGRAGEISRREGQRLSERNPIVDRLPIQKALYSIGYRQNDDRGEDITLTVHASTGYWEQAIEELRSLDIPISNYTINFIDRSDNEYRNPFAN